MARVLCFVVEGDFGVCHIAMYCYTDTKEARETEGRGRRYCAPCYSIQRWNWIRTLRLVRFVTLLRDFG